MDAGGELAQAPLCGPGPYFDSTVLRSWGCLGDGRLGNRPWGLVGCQTVDVVGTNLAKCSKLGRIPSGRLR